MCHATDTDAKHGRAFCATLLAQKTYTGHPAATRVAKSTVVYVTLLTQVRKKIRIVCVTLLTLLY